MTPTLADIIRLINALAPPELAEEWDNPGVQVGSLSWAVRKIWVALDPLPEVIKAAVDADVDLLVTHHPLIFKPLQRIDVDSTPGALVSTALQHQLAIYTAHTNLDIVSGGINDILAAKIGLENIRNLCLTHAPLFCKLILSTSEETLETLLLEIDQLLTKTESEGNIQTYTTQDVRRLQLPLSSANLDARPEQNGRHRRVHLEMKMSQNQVAGFIEALNGSKAAGLFEHEVQPLIQTNDRPGIGRVGFLSKPMRLQALAHKIKAKLKINAVKMAGNPDLLANAVALCSGSGSSLIKDFIKSKAQVYISGDLRYHDARAVEAAGLGMIDIGHFASEHLFVETFIDHLAQKARKEGFNLEITACTLERDPFQMI